MPFTKQQLAVSFSKGDFEEVFPYLSENVNWEVIKQFKLNGKKAVIEKCEKTAEYLTKLLQILNS